MSPTSTGCVGASTDGVVQPVSERTVKIAAVINTFFILMSHAFASRAVEHESSPHTKIGHGKDSIDDGRDDLVAGMVAALWRRSSKREALNF